MKILLLNLPFKEDYFYKKDFFKKGKQSPLFPIGLSYVAKALIKQGHEVKILDIYAEQLPYSAVIEKLKTLEFEIIGISALVTQYKYCKWLCGEIKKINPASRLILGNGLMMKYYFHKMEINYLLNALTSVKKFIYLIKKPKTILRLLKITVRHYVRIINGDYPFVFSQKNIFYRIVKRI